MNKVYKIVKNNLGLSQVTGEFAKGNKKSALIAASIGISALSFSVQAAIDVNVDGFQDWTNNTILSEGIIVTGGNESMSYKDGSITNSGTITNNAGDAITINKAAGVGLNNNGIIKTNNGNAIKHNNNGQTFLRIGNVNNSGYISGNIIDANSINSNGNAIIRNTPNSNAQDGTITNTGILSGYAESASGTMTLSGNAMTGNRSGGIINNGVITGKAITANNNTITRSGNGIYEYNSATTFSNHGLISGEIHNGSSNVLSGNGIITGSIASSINNTGIIEGSDYSVSSETSASGNGIAVFKKVTNTGVIHGYKEGSSGSINPLKGNALNNYTALYNSGYLATNAGVLKGSNAAIHSRDDTDVSVNYGVMAGSQIVSLSANQNGGVNSNYGTYITLDINGTTATAANIEIGSDTYTPGSIDGQNGVITTVVNAALQNGGTDSFIRDSALQNAYNDTLINGAGMTTGTLTVDSGKALSLTNSIVNGYKTALTLDGAKVTAVDTVFNGGGLLNNDAVIAMGSNSTLALTGNSILNGNVHVSGSGSTLSVGNSTAVNADLMASGSNNTLNLGDGSTDWGDEGQSGYNPESNNNAGHTDVASGDLHLFHKVDGFDNINVAGRVTTYETARISTGNINIGSNSELVVRVDGTETDDKGRVVGHALYDHQGALSAELPNKGDKYTNPQLIFKTSGLATNTVIAMDGTDISKIHNFQVDTYSILNTAIKNQVNGVYTGDFIIKDESFDEIFYPTDPVDPVDPTTPGGKDDNDFNDIYESIKNAGELPELAATGDANDSEKARKEELLSLLDQIYANNPYVQSAKLSHKNLALFRDKALETKMPELHEWIVQAHGIYASNKDDIKRHATLGNTSINNQYSNSLSTYGLLTTGEYGIAEKTSLGFAVGMSHQKANMSVSSDLDGNAVYLGTYGKKKVDNFTFSAGVAYQYGTFDGTRNIANKYQSLKNTGSVKTDAFDIYGQAKYTYQNAQNVKIEPKVKISQSIVKQHAVSEKKAALAIDMDNKTYSVPAVELGLDVSKSIPFYTGNLDTKFSAGVERTFGGNTNKTTGRMKGSTDFKGMGPDFEKTTVKLNVSTEYEDKNGMFINTGVGTNISKDTKNDINAFIGIGYRF
ncbi:outer membrane autotransporter barrel domain protein [Providencia rettgeri DSM 1131]|uniref:autotransporter domain-containing protein n=1 Tax=Providencia rettgeri TaxID=587 RepID=UPI000197C81D|nr:autotransporter domain-containing protein [Providencia rettgeri]EFE51765.1 outer membrane autotransporter barrel domain protein [Providencia rettgeri DSM 1131]QXA58877.1 autotransporter domain-containing protein [Providencia rettgeri]